MANNPVNNLSGGIDPTQTGGGSVMHDTTTKIQMPQTGQETPKVKNPTVNPKPGLQSTGTQQASNMPSSAYQMGQSMQQQTGSSTNPFVFAQAIDMMKQKMQYNNGLMDIRNKIVTQMFDRPLKPEEMQGLSPDIQKAISSGDRPTMEMYLRLTNDEIQGRTQSLDSSVKFLTDTYQQQFDNLQKMREDSLSALKQYSPDQLTALYGQDYVQKLQQAGIDLGGLSGYEVGKNIGGYDITKYATDPNHEKAISSIYQGIQQYSQDPQSLDSYIKNIAPNSPVNGQMITDAAKKYGVDAGMVASMMQQDSSFGTAGKAVRTRNPGNVGNDDTGKTRTYASWKDGVEAVAEWLSKHRSSSTGGTGGTSSTSPSPELLDMINKGQVDPGKLNSRTIGIYNSIAKSGISAAETSATVKGNTKAYEDLQRYQTSTERVIRTLDSNMPLLYNLADKVNKMGIPKLDAFISGTSQYTGNNPDVIKYISTLKTLRSEYAQMLSRGQAVTESERSEAHDAIPAGLDSATYKALGEQLKLEGKNIIDAANTQKKELFGNSSSSQSSQKDPLGIL